MATCPDIGTTFRTSNLGEGTLTIGSGGDFIVANASDITISTSQCIETGDTRMRMSRNVGNQRYSEEIYMDGRHIRDALYHDAIYDTIHRRVQNFEQTTSSIITSGTYASSGTTSTDTIHWPDADVAWQYPEEVTIAPDYPETTGQYITYGDYHGSVTVSTDNSFHWYVVSSDGEWTVDDVSCRQLTHYEVMQQKIDEAWDLYCRNEKHAKEMQKKIDDEWWLHLQREKLAEAERIRLLPEKKANELMEMLIGEKEHKVYEKTGRVFVKGKNGLYMVKRGGGVSKIEGNKIIDFCVHIESCFGCPPTDHAIALKMMLEDDDRKVIKIANRRMTREVRELPLAACM